MPDFDKGDLVVCVRFRPPTATGVVADPLVVGHTYMVEDLRVNRYGFLRVKIVGKSVWDTKFPHVRGGYPAHFFRRIQPNRHIEQLKEGLDIKIPEPA